MLFPFWFTAKFSSVSRSSNIDTLCIYTEGRTLGKCNRTFSGQQSNNEIKSEKKTTKFSLVQILLSLKFKSSNHFILSQPWSFSKTVFTTLPTENCIFPHFLAHFTFVRITEKKIRIENKNQIVVECLLNNSVEDEWSGSSKLHNLIILRFVEVILWRRKVVDMDGYLSWRLVLLPKFGRQSCTKTVHQTQLKNQKLQ